VRALTLLTVIGAAVVLGWLLVSIREVIAGLFAGLGRRDSEEPSVTMWQKDADGKVRREIVDLDSERLSDDERAMGGDDEGHQGMPAVRRLRQAV
jgi:hypothetical protein